MRSFVLLFYSIFRIIAELFREPDLQIGYILILLVWDLY